MAKQWKYKAPKRSLFEIEANKRFEKIFYNEKMVFTNIHTGKKLKGKIILSRWQQLDKLSKPAQDKFNKLTLKDQVAQVEKNMPRMFAYYYEWVS